MIPVMLADWRQVPNSGPWKRRVRASLFLIVTTEPAAAVFAENRDVAALPFGIAVASSLIIREGNRDHGEDSDHDCLLELDSRFPYRIGSLMNAK